MSAAADVLGPGGRLQRILPGYESRHGQQSMAEAVERALREERVLLCEAGTGTGKTLAYLLPAALSGKKVVVSTATRALQEQIAQRDIPLIERALGVPVRAAVMKGIANYVCRRRHGEFVSSAEAARPAYARALGAVASWIDRTEVGDVAELVALAEDDRIWREITSSSETRIGAGCAWFDQCFVTRMKREAELAQIVVVNHHLFFADLALRGPHPARILPDYDAVIFDEAHQLEDIMSDFFGVRVSHARIERLMRDAERALALAGLGDPLLGGGSAARGLDEMRAAEAEFWRVLAAHAAGGETRVTLERDVWQGPVEHCWHRLDAALEGLRALLESSRGRLSGQAGRALPRGFDAGAVRDALDVSARRAEQLREHLLAIVDGAPGRVTWLDQGTSGRALSSTPIDVSAVFRDRVLESVSAVVLTSATLAGSSGSGTSDTGSTGAFGFLRARLGFSPTSVFADELVVASPFAFDRRAVLYTPRDLPSPRDERFIDASAERIAELVEITGGGAFVLTTSLRSMRALHSRLRQRLGTHQLLLQGDAPKSALIGAFRAAGDAVLVATTSFWEGVDVPGRALRLVVLEKIPFAVPSDPLVRARALAIESEGGNPFVDYHVPAAAIALKQGFGRLIRSSTDAGVVALLDERVHRRGYGKRLLAALPPARRSDSLDEVREFWREITESDSAFSSALGFDSP
jgi:ATP-dependent DNA helicase DinG